MTSYEPVEVTQVGDVTRHGACVAADPCDGRVERIGAAAGEVDERPLVDETLRHGQPDARAGAGDQRDLSFQTV